MRADSATIAKSQLRISSSPPAAVTPLTSATTGTRSGAQPAEHAVQVARRTAGKPTGSRCSSTYFFRSPPALNARPLPVTRTAAHRAVGLDGVERLVEPVEHLGVDRVELVGPVEADERSDGVAVQCHGARAAPIAVRHRSRSSSASAAHDLVLLDLARRGRRQRVEHLQPLRQLVVARPASRRRCTTVARSSACAGREHHARAHRLAQPLVGQHRPRPPAPPRGRRRAAPRSRVGRC